MIREDMAHDVKARGYFMTAVKNKSQPNKAQKTIVHFFSVCRHCIKTSAKNTSRTFLSLGFREYPTRKKFNLESMDLVCRPEPFAFTKPFLAHSVVP